MDDFEMLLKAKESRTFLVNQTAQNTNSSIQQADKKASMFDFIKMINRIVTLTMQDMKVEFVPEEGRQIITDPIKQIEHPYIAYKVISRVPKGEIKPRFRQEIKEVTDDPTNDRVGEVFGQKFECFIQFDIFASEYSAAEAVMERFEDIMLMYAGHFKKNGVGEIVFKKQFTDETYNQLRQIISIRNLQYYVEIEKLTVIFKEKVKEIETFEINGL
jgi:hypothetical protein